MILRHFFKKILLFVWQRYLTWEKAFSDSWSPDTYKNGISSSVYYEYIGRVAVPFFMSYQFIEHADGMKSIMPHGVFSALVIWCIFLCFYYFIKLGYIQTSRAKSTLGKAIRRLTKK